MGSSGHRKVSVDEIYSEIYFAISRGAQEIDESMNIAANMVTKELLNNIREDSPVGATGEYRKGWKRKKLKYSYVIYNAKKPWATHLLEEGHAMPQGGRSKAIKHIKRNEEDAEYDYEHLCITIVCEGLRLTK